MAENTKADVIIEIEISKLKPHPENLKIYGENENVDDLIEKVEAFDGRIIDALKVIVDKDNVGEYIIISGYRRWIVAQRLNIAKLHCEVVRYKSNDEVLAAIVMYNYGRVKTLEQKVREGMAIESTFLAEAFLRQLQALKNQEGVRDSVSQTSKTKENEDSSKKRGRKAKALTQDEIVKREENEIENNNMRTRDRVAKAVQISSGRTYDRAKKVVIRADEYKKNNRIDDANLLLKIMGKTVATAYKLLPVFDMLDDDIKKEIDNDLSAAIKYVPDSDNNTNTTDYSTAMQDVKAFGDTIKILKKAMPRKFKSAKQRENYKNALTKQMEAIQSMIDSIAD